MRRRNFLQLSSLLGGGLVLPLNISGKSVSGGNSEQNNVEVMTRVRNAMLSMQRASWEQGMAAQAAVETGENLLMELLAREAVLRQTEDGRLSVLYTDNGVTDPAASGEAVYRTWQLTGDNTLKEAAENMLHYLLDKAPKNAQGILYHVRNAPEIWVDSFYMAPPFLSIMGEHQEALRQIMGFRNVLWNNKYALFSHRWDDEKKQFVNPAFWGVGNGWAMAGMCRVVQSLPESMKAEKEELISYIRQNIDGCLTYMRNDYLFHNVIDDSSSFVETNLSQMLAYTVFRGIDAGWVNKKYIDAALGMRGAAHNKADRLGYVQGVCGAPYFNSPGRAVEGQAFFLLMENAYQQLTKKMNV
jgi:rhamnogalacturonyl hydrolase YesR